MVIDYPFKPSSRIYLYCCIIVLFIILNGIGSAAVLNKQRQPNKTALYRRQCINLDDPKLIEIQEVFQNLLPYRKKHFEPLSNEAIESLLLYLTSVSKTVEKQLPNDEIFATVWHDMVGDYLHAYLLPVSKYCFYAGNVSYQSVRSVLDYYKHIKLSIDTDGAGWSKPTLDIAKAQFKIRPLLDSSSSRSNCSELLSNSSGNVLLPVVEVLDDDEPVIISLRFPFRTRSVYDPRTRSSLSVLRIYYESVVKCVPKSKRKHFASHFSRWIDDQLMKHLMDEQFYPGLEAILRIRHTLDTEKHLSKKEIAAAHHGFNPENSEYLDNLFNSMLASDVQEDYDAEDSTDGDGLSTTYYVDLVAIVLGCSFMLLIIVIIVKLCKIRKNRKRKAKVEELKAVPRTKLSKMKDDQSDEDVLLLLEKNGRKLHSERSTWKHVKKSKSWRTSQNPSTSKQLPPFSESEDDDDDFGAFQPLRRFTESAPLLPKGPNTTKKNPLPRCERGCICMNCSQKVAQSGTGRHDHRLSSWYRLQNETGKTPEAKADRK